MKQIILATLLALAAVGCTTTVIPPSVHGKAVAFDGNKQNGGLVSLHKDRSGVITPAARERYNELVGKYGCYWVPPITHDEGISTNGALFNIDADHLAKFQTLNRWHKAGKEECK